MVSVQITLALIVIVSSVWVLIDAFQIGVRRNQLKGLARSGPLGWALGCLLLWIIVFPLYLVKRNEFKRHNGKPVNSSAVTIAGFFVVAIALGVIIMGLTGNVRLSTPNLRKQVLKNIETTFAKQPSLAALKIKSFDLEHENGDQYEGTLVVSANGQQQRLNVDVVYNGKRFMWKVRQ